MGPRTLTCGPLAGLQARVAAPDSLAHTGHTAIGVNGTDTPF